MSTETGPPARERWAARASLAAAALAVALPLAFGGVRGFLLLLAAAAAMAVAAAALWWMLTRRGPLRWIAGLLAIVLPFAAVVVLALTLLWTLLLSPVLWIIAVWCGRYALRSARGRVRPMKEHRTPPPRKPFVLMNPRSGGGKVERFGLVEKAERLGARVVLLDPEQHQDVTELARQAVADGADLLGVAGGDGTQALVAAVAAEHGLPFLVVSAGTRNHFAMDLGLDRDDPATCLDALTNGVELRVDLGFAGTHPFVNNASFGAYAAVVQDPAYRDDKIGTILELLPDLLTRQRGPELTAHAAGTTLVAPQAVLVSNNPYRTNDPAGLGRRERLDSGVLGVLGVKVDSAVEAAALLLSPAPQGLSVLTAREVVVTADDEELEAGIDGEAMVLPTPVRCRVEPGVLRVRVPRKRPGVPTVQPTLDWRRLMAMALLVSRTAGVHRPGHGPGRERRPEEPSGKP
ncbi:diacylglycerol/lipid kinase family protein [Streptomyces sp. NBC_00151]|uniref:diacylglycerol/lipid kinase family protein n=1 Tax=Streptomyces sp. NBC_00151 TaxID=2975669 RepID=UPI002DDC4941|nr:diacylglycerol kinase family protein [Streptomyces sp. NBC_00151]WRZ38704.1 diacylglycerol kinase family protein [Streptomyces sp. NBC_00151]